MHSTGSKGSTYFCKLFLPEVHAPVIMTSKANHDCSSPGDSHIALFLPFPLIYHVAPLTDDPRWDGYTVTSFSKCSCVYRTIFFNLEAEPAYCYPPS